MAAGRVARGLMGPLLAGNLVLYLIILGLSGWSLDKYINGEQNHPHLGGNPSTSFMLVFALIAGVTGACSVLAGLMHLCAWRSESLASAGSLATISWGMTALAFGLVCKEILGGHRGKRLQTLEVLIVVSLLSQLLYLGVLHAGLFSSRYGRWSSKDSVSFCRLNFLPGILILICYTCPACALFFGFWSSYFPFFFTLF